MCNTLLTCLLISIITTISVAQELPLCPTNIQFFPQNLPMHCRMPAKADFPTFQLPDTPQFHTMAPALQPFYQSPPPDEQPKPIPVHVPPGIPGAAMPFPGPVPMMPMPVPGPAHKLPVIVMPFYSPDPSFKKAQQPGRPRKPGIKKKKTKRPRFYSDTDTSSDTDTDLGADTDTSSDTYSDTSRDVSSDRGWWKDRNRIGRRSNGGKIHKKRKSKNTRRHNKHKKLLTPVLQYITEDGYVIFEKKISKDEAKEWLNVKTKDGNDDEKQNDTVSVKELHDLNKSEKVDRSAEIEYINIKPNITREEFDTRTVKYQDVEEFTTQKVHAKKHRARTRKTKSTRPQTSKTKST